MANETNLASAVGWVNTSIINDLGLDYAIDTTVALLHMRMELIPKGSATGAYWVPTKSTGVSASSEAALSNSVFTTAKATIAAAEYGILRQISQLALESSVVADDAFAEYVTMDGIRLCMEYMETQAWAQWTNASTSVGTSGANFTLANFAGAISQLAINKAPAGNIVAMLSTYQGRDLRNAILASTASVWVNGANKIYEAPAANGERGSFMGVKVFESNLAATSGGDRLGCLMVDGALDKTHAATIVGYKWMPRRAMNTATIAAMTGQQVLVSTAFGLGETSDYCYTKILTIGS